MATFGYLGLQYVTLEGTDNEVAVRSAPDKGRIIIPEYVENDGKRYVVTQVGHDSFRMTNKTEYIPGVRDNRMKDGWRVKPQYCESGSEPRGPFSPIYVAESAYSNPANSDIESVKMPASITKLWYGVFRKCRTLTSVDIPPKVTVIPDRAFSGCISLEKIDIHEGIVSIGKYAFIGCTALKEVTIPSSVKSIDYRAFVHSNESDCGVEVVNIYNDEGEVIIHPEAFAPNIKINYLGKKAASKEKTPKASQKQQTEESVAAPSIDLDKLINAVVADGVITDKERAVILKKAVANGYDSDEVEILLDAKLYEVQQNNKNSETNNKKK